MALAVAQVLGSTGGGAVDPVTSPTFTSTAGSLLVMLPCWYGGTGSMITGTPATDSLGNTWTFGNVTPTSAALSTTGVGMWYQLGGSRGSQTVSFNVAGSADNINLHVIEITGQSGTPYDAVTAKNAVIADTSPWNAPAQAAISGNQIAIHMVVLDTGTNTSFTNASGYTTIYTEGNGAASLVSHAAYKLLETGTPNVGPTSSHSTGTTGNSRGIFASFKEAATVNLWSPIQQSHAGHFGPF